MGKPRAALPQRAIRIAQENVRLREALDNTDRNRQAAMVIVGALVSEAGGEQVLSLAALKQAGKRRVSVERVDGGVMVRVEG